MGDMMGTRDPSGRGFGQKIKPVTGHPSGYGFEKKIKPVTGHGFF